MSTYIAVERDRRYRTCNGCNGSFWSADLTATTCPVCQRADAIQRMRDWKLTHTPGSRKKKKKASGAK